MTLIDDGMSCIEILLSHVNDVVDTLLSHVNGFVRSWIHVRVVFGTVVVPL